jgi:predicted O-methyltransferase YrrM
MSPKSPAVMIKKEIVQYAENHSTPELEILSLLSRETHLSQVYPQMLSGHLQGAFLRMIAVILRPLRILEIGTFTGYSALCLASGLAHGGALHTIEVNPELERLIRKFFSKGGFDDRIILHIGNALEIIPLLDEAWDLVFIDADKPNYLSYYKMVLPRLKPGGFILVDNVLWDGKVIEDQQEMDLDTLGIHLFNEYVQKDDLVENLMLPIRDGLMLIRKRDGNGQG